MRPYSLRLSAMCVLAAACGGDTQRTTGPAVRPTLSALTSVTCDISWATNADGDWEDASAWDLGRVPQAGDAVCIDQLGSYQVTVRNGIAAYVRVAPGVHLLVDSAGLTTPSLEAGSMLVMSAATLDVAPGAWLRIDTLDLQGVAWMEGTHEIEALTTSGYLFPTGSLTINGLSSLTMIAGSVLIDSGTLSLRLSNQMGNRVHVKGGVLGPMTSGAGLVEIVAAPGTLPVFVWEGGAMPGAAASGAPSVIARGMNVWASGRNLSIGTLGVDPAGDSIRISGTIAANAGMTVRPANASGNAVITLDSLRNEGDFVLRAPPSGTLTVTGSIVNPGTLETGPGRVDLEVDSLVNSGAMRVADSTRVIAGVLTNAGSLRVIGPGGALVVSGPAQLMMMPAGTTHGIVAVESGGQIGGAGTLAAVRASGGTITPGWSDQPVGTLTMDALELDAASRVIADVGGTTFGSHDRVHVTSHLTLSGELETRIVTPFVGGLCGQIVRPLTFAAAAVRTGSFSALSGTVLDARRAWRIHETQSAVELIGHDPSTILNTNAATIAGAEGAPGVPVGVCLGNPAPASTVSVDVVSRFGQSDVAANPITFTDTDWMLPKIITVSAVDDSIGESDHVDSIRFDLTSADPVYDGSAPVQLRHEIADDDPGADLTVAHVGGPTVVNVDQQFEGLFRVTNNGQGLSTGSTFSVAPLAGLAYVSSAASVTCTPSTGLLECAVGAVAAGDFVEFTVLFRATAAGAHANTLSIADENYDEVPSNDSSMVVVTVN